MMTYRSEVYTKTTVFFTIIFLVITFKLWLFGSLAVSTVKAISGSCGSDYVVEIYVVNGNWFCPKGVK
jgi:hypothetical protein